MAEEVFVGFAGGVEAEAFAGSVVEFVGDLLQLLCGVDGQVGALREVLADQAVDVFVASALVWAVGSAK